MTQCRFCLLANVRARAVRGLLVNINYLAVVHGMAKMNYSVLAYAPNLIGRFSSGSELLDLMCASNLHAEKERKGRSL